MNKKEEGEEAELAVQTISSTCVSLADQQFTYDAVAGEDSSQVNSHLAVTVLVILTTAYRFLPLSFKSCLRILLCPVCRKPSFKWWGYLWLRIASPVSIAPFSPTGRCEPLTKLLYSEDYVITLP